MYVALCLFPSDSGGKKTSNDEGTVEDRGTTSRNKPSFWQSIWKRNTFPRLVPAFGLLGKVPETFNLHHLV